MALSGVIRGLINLGGVVKPHNCQRDIDGGFLHLQQAPHTACWSI